MQKVLTTTIILQFKFPLPKNSNDCLTEAHASLKLLRVSVLRLDVRDTSVGDSEVPCFGRLPEIRSLHLGHSTSERFNPPSVGRVFIEDKSSIFCFGTSCINRPELVVFTSSTSI